MKFLIKTYISLLIALAFANTVLCQYKFEQPVIIDKEKGLPTNSVRSIAKGPDGFIWIATLEGLCRFDGQNVKVFRLSDDKQYPFFENDVYAVLPLQNEVWIGTSHGISVLNTSNETFRHYQLGENKKEKNIEQRFDQTIAVLYQDKQKEIWIGSRSKGLWRYERKKDDFKKIEYPEESYQKIIPATGTKNSILSIEESITNDSIIWAGTTAGLQEVNRYNGHVKWYTYPKENKNYQVSLNAFRKMYHHDDGLLYVGSWNAGVNVFDPATKTFTPLELKNSFGDDLLISTIAGISRKDKNEIWITTGNGLVAYNTEEKLVTWLRKNERSNNKTYGIQFIDESDRVWNYEINGIEYFDPVVQQFSNYSYKYLYTKEYSFAFYLISDKAGNNITVCPRVADGLYHFDKLTQQWSKSPFKNLGKDISNRFIVRGFAALTPDEYIISTDIGLYRFSMRTKKLSPIATPPGIKFKRWGEVLKDAGGNIWISATDEGLVKWNIKNQTYRYYTNELTLDGAEPGEVKLNNLFQDSKQNIWAARPNGFSVHLFSKDTIINFLYNKIPDNSFPTINSFKEDNNGKIWVASSGGMYGYIDSEKPEEGVIKKFNLKQNNIDGYLISLAKDSNGDIWGYTPYELIKINTADASVSTYSFYYGVKAVDFYHFSFLPSGELIFGGRNGITIAKPSELERNKELPEPYIVQIKILNKSDNSTVYTNSKAIELSYNRNFISIYFSAKAYTVPEGVRFRYRLYDFDNWNEVAGGQFANYTNIPPGHYTFQLQAANNEGIWNVKTLEIPIHIKTPWWLTWWFRILFLVLLTGTIYALYQNRVSQIRKKEKLKTQFEKKLANVEMTALLAQMNPHFLFNSLNSIDSYIIKNESGKASEYLNNFARLMRLILQNSRSNYTSLKDEIELLDLYLQMESLRFKDKFQYEINIDENLNTGAIVIPPMLIQPYVENAIWHGLMHKKYDGPGKVDIIMKEKDNQLICIIEDNGIGREKAAAIKAQKPGNHKRSMGMQITKDRIDLINKLYNTNTSVTIIDLKDDHENPTGTRVELVIPF